MFCPFAIFLCRKNTLHINASNAPGAASELSRLGKEGTGKVSA
jgi:hypothetical protein